ncbi:MAG: tetratricopeptide repeat protein [Candidatus Binataceae bacterium]
MPLLIAVALIMVLQWPVAAWAKGRAIDSDDQVCDPLADYYLGMEDYPQAIRRHLEVIRDHPKDALAYYHLGFAYGMLGNHRRELADYKHAVELGLSDWQLFANLGLAYMGAGQMEEAIAVLRLATLLGPYHPETHYDLGLAYERADMTGPARQEVLTSLRLDPSQLDARDTLGVIYAEQGDYVRARQTWTDLAGADPAYSPARVNLSILKGIERGEFNRTRPISGFAH